MRLACGSESYTCEINAHISLAKMITEYIPGVETMEG